MALTAEGQKLLDFALAALPTWFKDSARSFEFTGAAAKINENTHALITYWFEQALITQADGPTAVDPDWLNQHAKDRGTSRQLGETDAALAERLKNTPDALTRPTILSAAQSIIDAEAIIGSVVMVELRRDRAHFGDFTSDSGTGGTFTDEGLGVFKFTPDVKFATPLTVTYEGSGDSGVPQLAVSGAASAGNDGTFPLTGLGGDGALFANGSGVAEVDATASWSIVKRDLAGNVKDGFGKAYLSRGHRMGSTIATVVFILPFGCTPGTESSIIEMARQKKGAGVRVIVECRANP